MDVSAGSVASAMSDVESRCAIVETTANLMNRTLSESDMVEVETEQSPMAEQLEPQKPIEDGVESDRVRTHSDDEDDASLARPSLKQELLSPKHTAFVEIPKTPIQEPLSEAHQDLTTSGKTLAGLIKESSRDGVEQTELIAPDQAHPARTEAPVEASPALDEELLLFKDAHQELSPSSDARTALEPAPSHFDVKASDESIAKWTISTEVDVESVTSLESPQKPLKELTTAIKSHHESSTPEEKVTEPMTPVDQSLERTLEDNVAVAIERPEVAQLPLHPVPLPSLSHAKAEDDEKVGMQPHEVELTVQDEDIQGHGVELVIPSPKRPAPLSLVHHDMDNEGSDSDYTDSGEGQEVLESADLGTPLGYSGAADFEESQDEFASHRFFGPSVVADPSSARALHTLRRVALHDKPPRFVSDAPIVAPSTGSVTSSGESSGRNSSSASAIHASNANLELRSKSEAADYVERPLNSYTLTFTEQVVGFNTNVVVSLDNELLVEVCSVERDSPAQRGGVFVGDCLVSVNGLHIEPHMTKEQVVEIIQTSTLPRTLVFQRDLHDKHGGHSKSLSGTKGVPVKPLMGRLGAAMSQGVSIIGSRWKRKKPVVHAHVFCDGCGMDPVVGALWTCSVCSSYNLCSECYELGTHGVENTEQMQALNEAIVQYKLQKKCKRFTPEFFLSLRRDICKGRPDKFEYLGEWIANIVVGTSAAKITVRGIEIPSLPPTARQRFVSHLMPLVSNRTDIEVNIEWLPDDVDYTSAADRASVDRMSIGAYDIDEEEEEEMPIEDLEKLRIWISDKKTRTTSPFA